MDITYTLTVSVTRPVKIYDTEFTIEQTAEWMASRDAQRELEKEVLKALRKLDGDCDVEVLTSEMTESAGKAGR
jgi:hypothetical protein